MSLSLVVACLTRSQVMAMVWIDAVREERVSSSRVEGNVDSCALERMLARHGCPKRLKKGVVELCGSFIAATSSGMGKASRLFGLVGCFDIASAALCLMPGMWNISKR